MHSGGGLALRIFALAGVMFTAALIFAFIGWSGAKALGGAGVDMAVAASKFVVHSFSAATAATP